MQDLKDLKRFFLMRAIAGDRPPRYGCQGRLCFTVGRGPVPRRASIGTENGVGWRAFFAQVVRSRGTGPRATGPEGVRLSMCRFGIRRSRTTVSSRAFRTLMSIEYADRQVLKVF